MKSCGINCILAFLLISNGLIKIFRLADEEPMGTCLRMAALTETLMKLSPLCIYSNIIVFILGLVYVATGVLCCFTKWMNVFAILVSLISIIVFDNPFFSRPEYCKILTVLSHILVIGIAFEGLEREDEHKKCVKVKEGKINEKEEKKPAKGKKESETKTST